MNNYIALSSLSLDLERIAMSLYHKSYDTADRFTIEAKKRISELDRSLIPPYINTVIKSVEKDLHKKILPRTHEDFLMYSTLIQNYVIHSKLI